MKSFTETLWLALHSF